MITSDEKQQLLIAEIRRVAAILGVNRLSQREFDRHHALGGVSTVGYQFGSWNSAVVAADLIPNLPGSSNTEPKIDATDLLEEILRLRDEFQKLPSERLLSRFGRFSLSPYRDRWGSLKQANTFALAYEQQRTRRSSTA